MLMKVFPHGTGEGDKPSRYLVRPDYPGRDTAPPQVLQGFPPPSPLQKMSYLKK
ncbi:hypothetical protein [Desulfovibrio sp. ZJ200]|uniref:hypothetical protein n=1 Tax=Desulfovibrio sp. ZJ200 TaxID=2709792 RepID=UPI0013EA4ADC|nr:hypothetical protein [Desulfovibrio sp. ZJ200]